MQVLFSFDFSHDHFIYKFTIYQLSDNLFRAASSCEVIVLWKTNNVWEGVSNKDEPFFINLIGLAIDKHFIVSANH